MLSKYLLTVVAMATISLTNAPQALATFVLIEDFESGFTAGNPIDNINGWTADNTYTAQVDPADSSNTVAHFFINQDGVPGENRDNYNAYKALGVSNHITDGTSGTLFMRIRFVANNRNANYGLSDENSPNAYNDFESQINFQDSTVMQARDGGDFVSLNPGGNTSVAVDNANVWYNVWMVPDNDSDTSQIYVQSDDDINFINQTQLFPNGDSSEPINFRFGTTDALTTLFLRSNNGTMYWDDFYIDNAGANLTNPIPEPTSGLLLVGGLITVVGSRRRRS